MRSILALSILVLYAGGAQAQPQTFSSGSTGADGPLTYAANLGTVYFPPTGLAPRASNIYNFTTITIGAGTTVRVSGWVFTSPVYWLAQSDVTITGEVDISGQIGHAPNNPSVRAPSEPGAGGYSGGVAHGSGTGQNGTAGNGPGGGGAPGSNAATDSGGGGNYSGNTYLQPLIGGSGGGGGCHANVGCGGGGGGGGAILIASATKITLGAAGVTSTVIDARGGAGGGAWAGGGSGGAIRLVANTITQNNNGILYLSGGPGGCVGQNCGVNGGAGVVRVEGYTVNLLGGIVGTTLTSTPYNLALPVGGPSTVSVTSVNNVTINANPFSFPDTTITTGAAVPVVISGMNIPPGTTGNLLIYSESAADQVIPFTLTGTLASTTATVNVPYPSGGSRGFAKAVWTSQ